MHLLLNLALGVRQKRYIQVLKNSQNPDLINPLRKCLALII